MILLKIVFGLQLTAFAAPPVYEDLDSGKVVKTQSADPVPETKAGGEAAPSAPPVAPPGTSVPPEGAGSKKEIKETLGQASVHAKVFIIRQGSKTEIVLKSGDVVYLRRDSSHNQMLRVFQTAEEKGQEVQVVFEKNSGRVISVDGK